MEAIMKLEAGHLSHHNLLHNFPHRVKQTNTMVIPLPFGRCTITTQLIWVGTVPLAQVACISDTNNLQQSTTPSTFSFAPSHLMLQTHSFRCSAFISVAPAAQPLRSFATTSCISGSIRGLSGTGMGVILMGSNHPKGGTAAYNSTLSAIYNANVSGQAFGAWSSADQYHPLRWCHASTNSPAMRFLSISDAVFEARKRQSATKRAFTCRPRPRDADWKSIPFLCNSAQWSMSFHLSAMIQLLAGHSHRGGVYHVLLQLLVFSIKMHSRAAGEGDGELLCLLLVPLWSPPPLCINDSKQHAMIRVVAARHPNTNALESLRVGFPSKEVVALRGDPSPLPPHPLHPPPPEPFPWVLAEMSGHIDKVHGIHLFGYPLLAFHARGTKVDVQVVDQNGMCTHRACAWCYQHLSTFQGQRGEYNIHWQKIGWRSSLNAKK